MTSDLGSQTAKDPAGTDPATLRDGNREAVESFVRHNMVWMLPLAKRILKDDQLAEDAVQGAFANIFKNLDGFEGRSSGRTWMHRIVVNQALMILRARKRLNEDRIDDVLPTFDENGCRIEDRWSEFETPESLMQQSQTIAGVAGMIERLPEPYRVVLLLRDIEEMPTAEVAGVLALSEANVKVRLHRARAALKRLLEPLLRGEAL